MKKLLFLMTLTTLTAQAGTITVKGISNIGQAPDYLELNIRTQSKCYVSAK